MYFLLINYYSIKLIYPINNWTLGNRLLVMWWSARFTTFSANTDATLFMPGHMISDVTLSWTISLPVKRQDPIWILTLTTSNDWGVGSFPKVERMIGILRAGNIVFVLTLCGGCQLATDSCVMTILTLTAWKFWLAEFWFMLCRKTIKAEVEFNDSYPFWISRFILRTIRYFVLSLT